jgi:hypothetical protein
MHDKYGIGFFVHKYKNMTIVEHAGKVAGYSAQLSFDYDSKYGVVLLRNYNAGRTGLSFSEYTLLQKLKSLNN